ncbi:hypothetical protein AAC387_Pa03g4439 [Persea americana]
MHSNYDLFVPDFLSIDCGIAEDGYTNDNTTIFYTLDAKFIQTGTNKNISGDYITEQLPRQYQNMRFFPDGNRSCYTLTPVTKSNRYLLRASFMYGNYDGLNNPPKFDVYVGVNRWEVTLSSTAEERTMNEIIVDKADGSIHKMQYWRNGSLHSENQRFTYTEVVNMTNNFERPIGNGGFGTVYHGQMREGTQVAVKMLSVQSVKLVSHPRQGSNEFQNEAQLLMRVHHKNVVPFIGYCQEGDNMALIYEYMALGNLGSHLSVFTNRIPATWI